MTKFLPILAVSLLCGCAVYKVEKNQDFGTTLSGNESLTGAELKEGTSIVTTARDGKQCSFFMVYLFTVGFLPYHCVTTYDVSIPITSSAGQYDWKAEYMVTNMQGWFLFFMPIFPQWKIGFGNDAESEIRSIVIDDLN